MECAFTSPVRTECGMFVMCLLLGLCGVCSPWSVCEVVVVPYGVGAVVAVTVMHVLLFVLRLYCMSVCCEGDGNAGVVAVSAYMGGTRGSGVLASAGDVLEMSVVRGVGGVCGMCLARGGVWWEVLGANG